MNRPGMMVCKVDLSKKFYDPMAGFREMAISGKLNNGRQKIDDPRSRRTKNL
jgi:hypothetical protein